MKSMYVKRIGTIATSAVMLGAALSGAVGASVEDLNKDFFYNDDMSPKVTLVVGSNAEAADGIAAANLAATIGNLAYTSETTKIESDPVVCTTQVGGAAGAVVGGEGTVVLSTTATGYRGVMDQDKRPDLVREETNFYTIDGVVFGGGDDVEDEEKVTWYTPTSGEFKEIKTTEVCEARTDKIRIDVLLDQDYINNQCFLCYDICQDTVTDLEHEMEERIGVDKDGITFYEDGVEDDDVDEELKMAVEGDTIQYSVYADFVPPTFLKNADGDLIDSRYRGKMMLLGKEYLVKDWDGGDRILKLAKGVERKLDNKAFGGDFPASDGTYQFKIHRAIYSEDQVAGIVVDVKKPDGTEVQVIAQRSLNAVVGNIEIYASAVSSAGDFVTADVKVYDLSTEVTLEDNEWLTSDEEWFVDLYSVPLGCVVEKLTSRDGELKDTGVTCTSWILPGSELAKAVDAAKLEKRFKDYQKAGIGYAEEEMLAFAVLTLRTDYNGEDALSVGEEIAFPFDSFQFSYEGYKTDNFIDPRCSGDEDEIEIKKVEDHQVTISFTNDNGDRYDDVHLDQGPIQKGELFMVGGKVYEFVETDTLGSEGQYGVVEVTIKDMFDSKEIKTSDGDKKFDNVNPSGANNPFIVEYITFDDEVNPTAGDDSSTHYQGRLYFDGTKAGPDKDGYINATFDGRNLYLAQMTAPNDPVEVGVSEIVVGDITQFDIDDNKLKIYVRYDNGDDNADRQDDDTYIVVVTESDVECVCTEGATACNETVGTGYNCHAEPIGESALIDFYDKTGITGAGDDANGTADDWQNSVYVTHSMGSGTVVKGILDDEDNSDTLWLPNGGDKIVADYGSDDEIVGVTICHPKTKVYQTYFLGEGKNETTTTITITKADEGELVPELGYTIESFGVSITGAEGNATTTTEVTNVTAVAECETNLIMPVGNLVVSDAQSPSGNLVIIGGSGANTMGLTGLVAGDSKVELVGNKLYVAGYTAAQTQQAANQVNSWLKANAQA